MIYRPRQQRSIYTRVPDGGSFRTNSPNGFLIGFPPVPQPGDASDIVGQQAAWWYGSDGGASGRTTGSPLTEPSRTGSGATPKGSVLPAITRCLSIIVESVVRTRWVYHDGQGRTLPRPLWVDDPMLLGRVPGPVGPLSPAGRRLEGQAFFGTVLADAVLWGRGAFTFIESSDGTPLPGSLMLLNPFMVDVNADGRIVLDPWGEHPLVTDFDGRFELNGDTWRVAVMPGLYPNHHGWPQGVLLRHFDTFRVGARLTGYLDGMFTSGVPSGYLQVSTPNFGAQTVKDPDTGQMVRADRALKQEWMAAHGSGRRSVAVLNSSVTYTPIAINPVDADVANLLAASRTDVAHAFGMSSIWLDLGASGMCVDEQTTAYTRGRGWVGHADLHEGDEVLALDTDTGLAVWSKVTGMNVFDWTGKPVVEYSSAYHSSVTTLAHRWPVLDGGEIHWTTTGEGFDKSQSIILGAPLTDLPTEAKFSDAFVELVAWFYTEGNWTASKRNVAYIGQSHEVNPAECVRIRSALTSLFGPENTVGRNGDGATWYEKRGLGGHNPGMSSFRLSREASAPLLDLLGPDKVVPFDFVDSLTRAQLEMFLHVSVLADGHHDPKGARAFFQKRMDMADAFQRAALLLGIPAPVSRRERPGESVQHRIALPTRTTLRMRGQKVSVRLHDGLVWCPTTEHGTWLASREGKPFFTGNSYSNSSERRADLVSMTAAGWGERLTNLLSSLMPYGSGCAVNWPSFIAPSVETLMPSLVAAVQAGILTATEARGYLGVGPWEMPDPGFVDTSKAADATPPAPVPMPEETAA